MICLSTCLLLTALTANPPSPPGMESWTFREDLARPYEVESVAKGEPWVKNRISRCFFGPIKRPPLFHDELMDDVDYYPDAYLDRLRKEGVNGLWLTVEWRDLAETSLTKRHPDAERRLAKLRKTVEKCLKYGIKTWIFAIDPKRCAEDDPLYKAHPEMFNSHAFEYQHVMCPTSELTLRYIEESVRDIFRQVPDLGGLMMIANGERHTSCLSYINTVTGRRWIGCERCDKREPWELYHDISAAIVRGIRKAGSKAEYISWFYHPQVPAERADWVAECAKHVPEGTIFAYNFESGAEREQLGKIRHGGDYWLSYVGPADGFKKVAAAARQSGADLGAKIQVCNSHECATVPYVPVPGLLYRKYRAMREAGVSTVLQCWYFGNYPGVMNRAAGMLSHSDFKESEDEFLRRLAASEWGEDAETMAAIWKRLSDAYAEYPLSNDMQYYGPFHAGIVWPLLPEVELSPLARTWKPLDPPSGDAIGECLENHTLDEACELASRMARGACAACEMMRTSGLETKYAANRERMLDIGVMKALAILFESGSNILEFYRARRDAVRASRVNRDYAGAARCVNRMKALASAEIRLTEAMIPLTEADSRLGFHSEAEVHLFFPAKLRWRQNELASTVKRLDAIAEELQQSCPYPESDFERNVPKVMVNGEAVDLGNGESFKVVRNAQGEIGVELDVKGEVEVCTTDALGTVFPTRVKSSDKTIVRLAPDAGRLLLRRGMTNLWPREKANVYKEFRLNLGALEMHTFGCLK